MTNKAQILDALNRKAVELAIGLRELAEELTAQADNFNAGTLEDDAIRVQSNDLQNTIYVILLRAELVERAARVFLSLKTLRYRPGLRSSSSSSSSIDAHTDTRAAQI